MEEPLQEKITVDGYEAREFVVRSGNASSARINVPVNWIGKKVLVIRLE